MADWIGKTAVPNPHLGFVPACDSCRGRPIVGRWTDNGIVIDADNVTLDLNGFALIGAPGSLNGVLVAMQRNNIVVKNGVVSNWGRAGVARSKADLEPDTALFGGDPHEESAYIEKYFWAPVSVKLDTNGKLYVTESNRHRVQIYG